MPSREQWQAIVEALTTGYGMATENPQMVNFVQRNQARRAQELQRHREMTMQMEARREELRAIAERQRETDLRRQEMEIAREKRKPSLAETMAEKYAYMNSPEGLQMQEEQLQTERLMTEMRAKVQGEAQEKFRDYQILNPLPERGAAAGPKRQPTLAERYNDLLKVNPKEAARLLKSTRAVGAAQQGQRPPTQKDVMALVSEVITLREAGTEKALAAAEAITTYINSSTDENEEAMNMAVLAASIEQREREAQEAVKRAGQQQSEEGPGLLRQLGGWLGDRGAEAKNYYLPRQGRRLIGYGRGGEPIYSE